MAILLLKAGLLRNLCIWSDEHLASLHFSSLSPKFSEKKQVMAVPAQDDLCDCPHRERGTRVEGVPIRPEPSLAMTLAGSGAKWQCRVLARKLQGPLRRWQETTQPASGKSCVTAASPLGRVLALPSQTGQLKTTEAHPHSSGGQKSGMKLPAEPGGLRRPLGRSVLASCSFRWLRRPSAHGRIPAVFTSVIVSPLLCLLSLFLLRALITGFRARLDHPGSSHFKILNLTTSVKTTFSNKITALGFGGESAHGS